MKGDRELCLQAGMDGYVAKPISRKDLQRAIGQTRQEGSGVPAAEPLPVELSRNDSQ
jgi:CheY-like chemotaxis protein